MSGVNKINVNVYVYSLDIPFSRVQQTAQFTPLVSELTLIRSHLLWGEFSAFSAANDISQCHFTFHNSPIFSFHQVPITAGWTEAVWYERFCPTPLHTSNFSDLRELVTLPCATIVSDRPLASINRCFTVIQGQWLVPLDATRQRHHICP